jgi:hypothetical protein
MAPPPGSDLTVWVVDIFRSPILIAGWKRQSGSVPVGVAAVKVEVEGENVHRRLTQETEGSAAGVSVNDGAQLGDTHAAGFRNEFRSTRLLSDIRARKPPSRLHASHTRNGPILTAFLHGDWL